MFEQLLDRLFEREEMDGDGRCATYLVRWTLLKLWGKRGVYLHHFVGDDWSRDLHDHPKRFISIGLKGGYLEETAPLGHFFLQSVVEPWANRCVDCGKPDVAHRALREYRAPWFRTFPAAHIHRIGLINGRPCWTLVIVLKTVRPWGFWHRGVWVPWREYVNSDTATRMKSCPD